MQLVETWSLGGLEERIVKRGRQSPVCRVVCVRQNLVHYGWLKSQTWLSRYPWPTQITYDQGTEFMAEFAEMVKNDYGIKQRPATTRNPQGNSVIERIHQTLGNIIRVYDYDALDLSLIHI